MGLGTNYCKCIAAYLREWRVASLWFLGTPPVAIEVRILLWREVLCCDAEAHPAANSKGITFHCEQWLLCGEPADKIARIHSYRVQNFWTFPARDISDVQTTLMLERYYG